VRVDRIGRRADSQLESSRRGEACQRVDRRLAAPMLVRVHHRPRQSRAAGELCLAQQQQSRV